MNKTIFIAAVASLLLYSCIDSNYDINKISIDTTIEKEIDIKFPIGSLESILLSDYIQTGSEEQNFHIGTNTQGDYSFNFNGLNFVIPTIIPSVGEFSGSANTGAFDNFSLPSIFTGENNHIVLSDIVVELTVTNPAPVPFYYKSRIKCTKDGAITRIISIGGEDDRILIPANSTIVISLSETGQIGRPGTTKHSAQGIELLFSPIADKIEFADVNLTEVSPYTGSTEYHTVKFDVAIHAPLAFNTGTKFILNTSLDNLNLEDNYSSFDPGISHIEIDFAIDNSLPLQLCLEATAVDQNKEVLSTGITLNASCSIEPGSIQTPTTTTGTIKLSGQSTELSKISGIQIQLNAEVNDAEFGGIPLNMNHFIKIKDISGHIVGKISL